VSGHVQNLIHHSSQKAPNKHYTDCEIVVSAIIALQYLKYFAFMIIVRHDSWLLTQEVNDING